MLSLGPSARVFAWAFALFGIAHLWGLLLVKVFRIELQEEWNDYRSPIDMYAHLLVRMRWGVVALGVLATLAFVSGA
jgi:hypothetical protein